MYYIYMYINHRFKCVKRIRKTNEKEREKK